MCQLLFKQHETDLTIHIHYSVIKIAIETSLTCLILVLAAQLPVNAAFSTGFSAFLESRYGSASDASYGSGND
jgi:hypothetical protein